MPVKGKQRGPAWGKIIAAIVVVAALAAAWRWTPLAEIVTVENILSWTRAVRGTWWAPIVMVAAYVPGSLVLFPRPLLTLVSVMSFGVLFGLVYSTTGVLLAAFVTYWIGRTLSKEKVRRIAGDQFERAGKLLREHGVVAVFGANMLPTPPFAVQNIIAGAVRIKLWQFMLGTFLALLPAMVAWAVFGDQLANAMDDSAKVNLWLIGGAVVLLVVFTFVARHFLAKRFKTA
jgi:phospholipase D1/2